MPDSVFLFEKANLARLQILDVITKTESSHVGSAYSILDILITLYHGKIDVEKIRQGSRDRDYVILSKGHAACALYAALWSAGLLDNSTLRSFSQNGSKLTGHPIRGNALGIECSTGSLGHGLSIGAGIAYINQMENRDNIVYVILSDGELNEGSVWEAVNSASVLNLSNLRIIIDFNKLQSLDPTAKLTNTEKYPARFQSYDCETVEIDGHNFEAIHKVLSAHRRGATKPLVVIAHTVKGKGVSFMQGKLEWHYRSPNPKEYEMAKTELLNAKYSF